jgi:nucleoside-diphosphate kinase
MSDVPHKMSKSAKRRANAKARKAAAAGATPGDAPVQQQQKKEKKQEPAESKSQGSGFIPIEGVAGTATERTFIAVKPDGVQRGIVGKILGRFEDKGFKLVALKALKPTNEMAAEHYSDLSKKGFFGGLCDFFSSGTIVAMVWEGKNAIKTGRVLLGETNPAASLPGSIRGDLCIDIGRNICHGSDGPEGAAKEINYWFNPEEICNWNPSNLEWVYEKPQQSTRAEKTVKTGKHHQSTAKLSPHGAPGTNQERTFIAIKPDGVQRGKIGNIIARFEAKGFLLSAMKMIWPTPEMAAEHYSDLSSKGFFKGLCDYFSMGPIIAMVWEGKGAILSGRVLLGETDPAKSKPGTIRGDLCIEVGRNICHGSDGPESAEKEIGFWFAKEEVTDVVSANQKWVYER